MAGHSKWHNIRHKKAANDAQKSKQFTKLNKEITIAARDHGGDVEHNPRLRLLLQKAKRINMPQDNVTRAIQKGTGELPGVHYESHMYEGYGPNGIAIIIEALTDNKNRAISEIRYFFNKHGGTITESGAVSWMFQRRGIVHARHNMLQEDDILGYVLEHDVNDVTHLHDGVWEITCAPQALEAVKSALSTADMEVEEADVRWIPYHTQPLRGSDYQKTYDFLTHLEQLDDVQDIYTNLTQPEDEKEAV